MFQAPFESTLCIVIHDWNQCQQNHTELTIFAMERHGALLSSTALRGAASAFAAFELGLAFCFRDWVRGQTGGPLGRAGGGGVNVTAPLQFLGPNSAIPNSCNSNLQSQFRIGAQSQYQFPHWGPNVNWGPFPGALQLHRAH